MVYYKILIDASDSQSGSEDESIGKGSRDSGGSTNTAGAANATTHDNPLATLQDKLKELNTAYGLVVKNSHQLTKFASELESGANIGTGAGKPNEKFALLKITSAAMVKVRMGVRARVSAEICPLQAAEEFVVQARNTERRWSRALQHEHSLRLQLQENMEALANQMHGLEDEARLSVQGILPSLHTAASHTSGLISPSTGGGGTGIPRIGKSTPGKTRATLDHPEKEEPDCRDSSDDEDKFFDASELSAEEWSQAKNVDLSQPSSNEKQSQSFSVGHRRSVSTVSVNDSASMRSPSEADVKEKLPQISSDRRMEVSIPNIRVLLFIVGSFRSLLVLLLTFMTLHLCLPLANTELVFLPNHFTNSIYGQS